MFYLAKATNLSKKISHRFLIASVIFTVISPVAQASNLVINGDFEAGNSGFSSDYTFTVPNTSERQYTITTNPLFYNPNFSSFGDHTTGTGKMMVVNGTSSPNQNLWQQTISIASNTNYSFSAWVASTFSTFPATLVFKMNNTQISSPFTASTTTGIWEQFNTTWNSGSSTSATLSIVNQNLNIDGNDFALDDISLTAVAAVPEPSMTLGLGIMVGLGWLSRRKQTRLF